MSTTITGPGVLDHRAVAALPDASPQVAEAWHAAGSAAGTDPPTMGLAAGDRPAADVEVAASTLGMVEYALAARLHAARVGGCLPLPRDADMLTARGWSPTTARRLARCAALAAEHPPLARVWAAGLVTAEHLDPLARAVDVFTAEEMATLVTQLAPHWGTWAPPMIARYVAAAARMLHPPPDPDPDEADAHAHRSLVFSVTGSSVLIAGELPRLDGEAVIAAIDALAETLRSTADPQPAAARRADALVQLASTAHNAGAIPSRGGLPVALSVTLAHTPAGDPVWTTSGGHHLTDAEQRWAACDPLITAIRTTTGCAGTPPASPAARLAALAELMFDTRQPLDVGRTSRIATPAQRRALAIRDQGCVIPGCGVPPEVCQTHHLVPWADGGATDLAHLSARWARLRVGPPRA